MPDSARSNLEDSVKDFLDSTHGPFINGEWLTSTTGGEIDVYNPATAQIIATLQAGGEDEIDAAVVAARTAFTTGPWPQMAPSERARLIYKLSDLLEQNRQILTHVEILDNGMPLNPGGALAVPLAAKMFRYYAGWVDKISGSTLPIDPPPSGNDVLTFTKKEPVGVAGQITPWNYPLGMLAMKLGPALATGCTIVLKPAELAPMSALFVGKLIEQAGFPQGVINIVPGYGEAAGAALASHSDVDKVAFTGSTEVGKQIIGAAASNLKKVSLELGGKSPFIIFADANLEAAIPSAVFSAFFLQGQNCMCGSRIFVHEDIHDQVADGMAAMAKSMKVGPGLEEDTRIGPLISDDQRQRVLEYIESGTSSGAELLCGGQKVERDGYFLEPTIFTGANQNMKIVREEIFGPVTCIQKFTEVDEVIDLANDTDYGLVGSVWTTDLTTAHTVAARIKAGTMGINTHGLADITAPFGGFKQSGWGREFGPESLELYLQMKTVCVHY